MKLRQLVTEIPGNQSALWYETSDLKEHYHQLRNDQILLKF